MRRTHGGPRKAASFFPSAATLLELLRLPNLFTVPGDILLGWTLGGMRGWVPLFGILSSLLLYACGLLLNDFCDARTDARERPSRPIPSGRVSRWCVLLLAAACAALGVGFALRGWSVAVGLLGLILFYDIFAKHIPGIGILTMGLCRGTNILLGAAVSWPWTDMPIPNGLLPAGLFFTLYILAVSAVALREADPRHRPSFWLRYSPVATLVLPLADAWMRGAEAGWLMPVCALWLAVSIRLGGSVPAQVGRMIRFLVPLQGVCCLIAGAPVLPIALTFAVLWIGAALTARRYASS